MADRDRMTAAALEIRGLNVHYGASHALQGVDLTLKSGTLSVVGRNGMGKTTLCKAIMGLVPISSGSIRFEGTELKGRTPAEIARLGIGYVPQGRRLWRSLTVEEHLRMVSGDRTGPWSIDRIYATFPRLAERKENGGAQLSGGEQQMLAIARALLLNPRLLVMDEPTEGLAPVIVAQLEDLLVNLSRDSEVHVLVIEQNIGVATEVAAQVAIMVNGKINRILESSRLSGDQELQQRLLGVGRHAHDEDSEVSEEPRGKEGGEPRREAQPFRIYISNPKIPTRWSRPASVRLIEQSARTITAASRFSGETATQAELRPLAAPGESVVIVAGTFDTKGAELRYIRDTIRNCGLPVRMADLSTSGRHSGAEIPAHQIAAFHPRGASGVFTGDRGQSVAGMTLAFERWVRSQTGIGGIIAAGGSGGTAIAAPAMRALPVGVPKLLVSTVASGDVRQYVGPADMTMMYPVADIQGLNSITKSVLFNAANALVGMVQARNRQSHAASETDEPKLTVGLTMFGVTTPCVQQIEKALAKDCECLIFHATGIGGQSMEKLVDSGLIRAVIDVTTTEIADRICGGVFAAHEDRFGSFIRSGMPYIGSCGALDMVNFGPPETVPERYRGRKFYQHNPQVTLMRTTAEENAAIGKTIGEKLNQMEGPVRFFLPQGGVSLLDKQGEAFFDPEADRALFDTLSQTVHQTAQRQLIKLPYNINDPLFVSEIISAFWNLHGDAGPKRQKRAARAR